MAALTILVLVLAVGLGWGWYTYKTKPTQEDLAELSSLALGLSPVFRAETVDPEQRLRARVMLVSLAPHSQAAQELQLAALAFIDDDLPKADQHLETTQVLAPEEPHLCSFRGAVHLRLSNLAFSQEMYLQSLGLKTKAQLPPLSLSIDQLGLALGLFMLHRPAEALPLAKEAWQIRQRVLGDRNPETHMASNRLATIYVALNDEEQAEKLLKNTFQKAVSRSLEREEARLLLAILYKQSNRTEDLAELEAVRQAELKVDQRNEAARVLLAELRQSQLEAAQRDAEGPEKQKYKFKPHSSEALVDIFVLPGATGLDSPGVIPARPDQVVGKSGVAPEPSATIAVKKTSPEKATPVAPVPEQLVAPAFEPNPPLPPPLPLTPEQLALWEETALALEGRNDLLAMELWDKILSESPGVGVETDPVRDKERRLELAQAAMKAGEFERALREFESLLALVEDKKSDEFMDLSEMIADSLAETGQLRAAEKHWQGAADVVDARLRAQSRKKRKPDPADVSRTLNLHLKLADNFLLQGRVPLEAKIELLAALGRLGTKERKNYPDVAKIYLELGRVTWFLRQTRESARHYRQAIDLAQVFLKKQNETQIQIELAKILEEAQQEMEDMEAKKTAPPLVSVVEPDKKDVQPLSSARSPESLQLEYTAMVALDRSGDFIKNLISVLKETELLHGAGSPEYMRFYTLKLKALEDLGLVNEITDELSTWAQYPPGRNDAERALNSGSSLVYAAEVNERAGRRTMAVYLYRKAFAALKGWPVDTVVKRRCMVEEALVRLGTAEPPPAPR